MTKQWPIVSVYAVLAAGLASAAWIDFRIGAVMVSLSVLWALVLRWRLSDSAAGMLRVRRRRIDLTVLAVLGVTMLVLALVVPHH